jgi:hypothetical protein
MTELQASRHIAAPATTVYDLVSDITRMGEWSPENTGGEWLDGAGGPSVGARFTGKNRRKAAWTTKATVTEADRGRVFGFVIGRPSRPDTRWQYRFTPAGDGCDVVETCEIVRVPGVIGRYLTRLAVGVPWSDRAADLQQGMVETLRRLAVTAEATAKAGGVAS